MAMLGCVSLNAQDENWTESQRMLGSVTVWAVFVACQCIAMTQLVVSALLWAIDCCGSFPFILYQVMHFDGVVSGIAVVAGAPGPRVGRRSRSMTHRSVRKGDTSSTACY
jgi:hypothetical protein